MRKIIFLLLFIFPALTFGQSFTGNYRAIFFNLFSEPKTIIAEFEVKTDNSIIGKVKVGDEIKLFNGTVDKKGKFEVASVAEGNTVFKLKGKFDKDNKISFVQRVQVGSGLNKSVSENGFEGSFAKVVNQTEKQVETPIIQSQIELIDNGKNWIEVQHSTPFFGHNWLEFYGEIKYETWSDGKKYFVLQVNTGVDYWQKQSFRITAPINTPDQTVWKAKEVVSTSYREEDTKANRRNFFISSKSTYTERRELGEGSFEIVKETDRQIVFKLSDFKIKRLGKDDFVTLNGFIYADK